MGNEIEKSMGHICFAGDYEYFREGAGDVWRAYSTHILNTHTGQRLGASFYCTMERWTAKHVPGTPVGIRLNKLDGVPDKNETEATKSTGHILFADGYEYFKVENGEVYRAEVESELMVATNLALGVKPFTSGNHRTSARFYCSAVSWPLALKALRKEKATAEAVNIVKCDNCRLKLIDLEIIPLVDVVDLGDRLDPGSIVPVGECRICGALVYQSVPVEEAAVVPAVPVPDKSNGHICFVDGYEYFRYAGDVYQVLVASGFEWLGINEKTRPDVFYRRGARSYCTDTAWESSPVARNIKKEEAAG